MLHILKSSRIRRCSLNLNYCLASLHHLRSYARPRKVPKPYDFTTFDPETNPNEASAIFTSLGWFYIPLKYNTDKQPRLLLEKEFASHNFTHDTSRDQVQEFIYNWCRGFTPAVYKKKVSLKAESEQKKLDLLFRQQMSNKVHSTEDTKEDAKISKRLNNKANGYNDKLRFKIDPELKQVEIRGMLKMTSVFNYYILKQSHLDELQLEKKELTSKQFRDMIASQWNELDSDAKEKVKLEYLELLASGKDLYLGNEVDLELRLSDEVLEDGFRFKKLKSDNLKRKSK